MREGGGAENTRVVQGNRLFGSKELGVYRSLVQRRETFPIACQPHL
jgi:hypothetical protein